MQNFLSQYLKNIVRSPTPRKTMTITNLQFLDSGVVCPPWRGRKLPIFWHDFCNWWNAHINHIVFHQYHCLIKCSILTAHCRHSNLHYQCNHTCGHIGDKVGLSILGVSQLSAVSITAYQHMECPGNSYGPGCEEICKCSERHTCDLVKGCHIRKIFCFFTLSNREKDNFTLSAFLNKWILYIPVLCFSLWQLITTHKLSITYQYQH